MTNTILKVLEKAQHQALIGLRSLLRCTSKVRALIHNDVLSVSVFLALRAAGTLHPTNLASLAPPMNPHVALTAFGAWNA
jgi:hypothetical protein